MKPFFLIFLFIYQLSIGQSVKISQKIDTTQSHVKEIYSLWNSYLNSPGILGYGNNKYWLTDAQENMTVYDFNSMQFGTNWYKQYDHEISSIKRTASDNYLIDITFWRRREDESTEKIATVSFLIKRRGKNLYLTNIAEQKISTWQKFSMSPNLIHYYSYYPFNQNMAIQSQRVLDSLKSVLPFGNMNLIFVHASDWDQLEEVSGLKLHYSVEPFSEKYYLKNIYFDLRLNEQFKGALVYIVCASSYPNAPILFAEGLSIWFTGEYMDEPIEYHYKILDKYFQSNPEVDILTNVFEKGSLLSSVGRTNPKNVISALIIELVYKKGGWKKTNDLLRHADNYSNLTQDSNFVSLVTEFLNVSTKELNSIIKTEVKKKITP